MYRLANIKSAKKRILVIETKTLRNKSIKSKVKTCIKNVEVAVAKGDKEAAQAALTVAISEISKATSKGIFHKNTASTFLIYVLTLVLIALFLSVFVLITLILFFADLIFAKVGTSNMIT